MESMGPVMAPVPGTRLPAALRRASFEADRPRHWSFGYRFRRLISFADKAR
jgi:hypothetical protein